MLGPWVSRILGLMLPLRMLLRLLLNSNSILTFCCPSRFSQRGVSDDGDTLNTAERRKEREG